VLGDKNINFDEAEKNSTVHFIAPEIEFRLVSNDFLKDIKLRSTRQKDLSDIARLEKSERKNDL